MAQLKYKIEFFDFWHTGSGLAGSTYADSVVIKDEDRLPFIPGKTMKGLLREAATTISTYNSGLVSADFIEVVFGKGEKKDENFLVVEGKASDCFFSNAMLSQNISERIAKDNLQNTLYHVLASTAIDDDGQAKEGSLRQLEVTVPLTLYGIIDNFPENQSFQNQMENCLKFVKQLGQNRNRGLGRCQISIIK